MTRNAGYRVRAGGLYNHIELENTNGDLTFIAAEFGLQITFGARPGAASFVR